MGKIKICFIMFFLLHATTAFANYYPTIQTLLSEHYSHSSDKENPWHKDNSESEMDNYRICENKNVPFSSTDSLLVMCPDTKLATSLNQDIPTDIYLLQKSDKGYEIIGAEKNIGSHYAGMTVIAPDKWAVELSFGSNSQGYLQVQRYLEIFSGSNLKNIAQWTAHMGNSNDSSSIVNNLIVERDKPLVNGFYPLLVSSTSTEKRKKSKKSYNIFYDEKLAQYKIPDDLMQGY